MIFREFKPEINMERALKIICDKLCRDEQKETIKQLLARLHTCKENRNTLD